MKQIITLKPGITIYIHSADTISGEKRMDKYLISDWETPRQNENGQWLFSATSEHNQSPTGPCPMIVDPKRIFKSRGQ